MEKEGKLKEEFRQGNISLILDSYDDIFSDFDPRPYNEKALSDDFLSECIRAARDKEGVIELILSIPKKHRNLNHESKIKKRVKDHFKKHHFEKEKEIKKIKRMGMTWVFIGAILMTSAALLQTLYKEFIINLLIIIVTPAGWFSFWEGLGKIFIDSKEKESDYIFYKKMSNSTITFKEY